MRGKDKEAGTGSGSSRGERIDRKEGGERK